MTIPTRTDRRRFDREIAGLAVPAFGALIAEPLYVLADTAVVGHLGTSQLAGLAVASTALLTAYSVFIFLAYGTTAAVSRLLGAGREREAAAQAVQSLWLALGLSLLAAGTAAVLAVPIVELLGAEGAVAGHALTYFRISLFGVPALLLTLSGAGYLRGLQDTRTPLVIAVATASANLVIELVLIQGVGFGIGASALSTVVAQVGGATVYLVYIGRAARSHSVGLRPDLRAVARLLRVGLDLLVRTLALRGAFTLSTAVAARIGVVDLGAHQVAFEVMTFLALALDALAIAGQAIIGRFLGADDDASARDVGNRLLELGVAGGMVVAVVLLAVREPLAGVFSDDPAVVGLAATVLAWVALLQPLNAVVFVLDGLLIGAGDMRFMAWAMTAAAGVFACVAAVVLAAGLGLGWLWLGIGLLMAVRATLLAVRWRSRRWAVVGAIR